MRFKEWLIQNEGSSGVTPVSYTGGMQDFAGQNLNTNMPVLSKISTKDGSSKRPLDAADGMRKPDATFGFKSPQDKNASQERPSQWIDKNRRRARVVTIPSDTIY